MISWNEINFRKMYQFRLVRDRASECVARRVVLRGRRHRRGGGRGGRPERLQLGVLGVVQALRAPRALQVLAVGAVDGADLLLPVRADVGHEAALALHHGREVVDLRRVPHARLVGGAPRPQQPHPRAELLARRLVEREDEEGPHALQAVERVRHVPARTPCVRQECTCPVLEYLRTGVLVPEYLFPPFPSAINLRDKSSPNVGRATHVERHDLHSPVEAHGEEQADAAPEPAQSSRRTHIIMHCSAVARGLDGALVGCSL